MTLINLDNQLPANIKLSLVKERAVNDAVKRKQKGKGRTGEVDAETTGVTEALHKNRLATLDIFAGCGGLSDGLEKAGMHSLSSFTLSFFLLHLKVISMESLL